MRTRLGCFVLVCLLAASAHAQGEKVAPGLQADVKKMLAATIGGDYETLVTMTHPKAIEAMGGIDKAKQVLKLTLDSLKASGFTTTLEEVGTPALANSTTTSYAVIPYTVVLEGAGKKITAKTAVVGISDNGGKSWKFLNINEQGEEGMRKLVPDLPRELKFPKQEQKVEESK